MDFVLFIFFLFYFCFYFYFYFYFIFILPFFILDLGEGYDVTLYMTVTSHKVM